ncbi:alpha hydrolase [Salarchaeum sp. JOR-1]|uniref:DUF7411 family protein n=1 Tax=Salarchaeum sp. JOR-1 TaxID=2599399 RepID=UPI0011989476|nr:alpha hydrolase [Salarchaeum sp. JOR-1]QDX40490.1 alpha hydrolase [Salarchaeum sp. JOR-1]
MELALLYSGGKDSTLAALVLERFYDVTLVTGSFGVTDDWTHARDAAERTPFDFERVDLDRDVALAAVERMVSDGYPRNGIQEVHEHALEAVAEMGVDAVADGSRRDDRVPTVSRAQAQSLEDRHDVHYLSPLSGFGRGAIDDMVAASLDVESGPSETLEKSDYESELRELLRREFADAVVSDVFPEHTQTRVRDVR